MRDKTYFRYHTKNKERISTINRSRYATPEGRAKAFEYARKRRERIKSDPELLATSRHKKRTEQALKRLKMAAIKMQAVAEFGGRGMTLCCHGCGVYFVPKTTKQIYCSKSHYVKYDVARKIRVSERQKIARANMSDCRREEFNRKQRMRYATDPEYRLTMKINSRRQAAKKRGVS